jgi:hypothetical protein
MGVIQKFKELFGVTFSPYDPMAEDVGGESYSNPTHAQFNRELAEKGHQQYRSSAIRNSSAPPVFVRPAINAPQKPAALDLSYFTNSAKMKALMLECISDYSGCGGIGFSSINEYVVMHMLDGVEGVMEEQYVRDYTLREHLKNLRAEMQRDGLIVYKPSEKSWYLPRNKRIKVDAAERYTNTAKKNGSDIKLRDISDNEARFLQISGHSTGWMGVSTTMQIAQWIHQNMTPDEFEGLCLAIMNMHLGAQLVATRKREVSNADGGADGVGLQKTHRGSNISVAIQAKCYNPDSYVGEDTVYEFSSLITRYHINHGYIMTSGLMSERAKTTTEDTNLNTMPRSRVILLDRVALTDIMLANKFGVMRTPENFLYINPRFLQRAAKDALKNPVFLDEWAKQIAI